MDNSLTVSKPTFKSKLISMLSRAWSFLKEKKYLYPSFLLPVGVMLIVYAILGVFPFGKYSILTLDMNAQYIYYFEQLRDILTGNGSLIYTWERVLGGEFLGFYAYYVASPFALVLLMFPSSMIVEAVTVMMLLKCGISGLCFAIYIDKTGAKRSWFSYAMFGTMYALCGYAMAYQSNTMWMDALMWLPLLTLGIESLVKSGKFKLYIIMLSLIIWSNYYIGYMACIYTLLYFVCYICAHKTSEINELGEKRHILKSFIRIAIATVVVLLIVSTVILCGYYSITFGKSDGEVDSLTFDLRFDFLDLIAKMFIGSYDTVRPAGLPNIYSGILTLFMLPAYFLTKKIGVRQKVGYGVLVLIFIACMSINALDLVWHGFQAPVWLNYRYSFMLSFLMLVLAYRGFEHFTEFKYKTVIQIGAMLVILLLLIQKTVLLPRYDGGDETPTMPDFELIWISLAFIFIYLVVLYFKKRETVKRAASCVLLCIVAFEAGVGALINWGEEIMDVGRAKRQVYRESIDSIEPTVDYILENDTSFYRMEKTIFRKPNENFALDIRGLSASTSTFNRGVMNLMNNCGFPARSHWSKYFEGNELVDSIFGIKYVISDEKVPVSNLYIASEGLDGLTIYENPYALSIAYCVDANMKVLPLENGANDNPADYLEYLASSMVGEDTEFFKHCNYAYFERDNCSKGGSGSKISFMRTDSNMKASFTYAVTAASDGSIYMYLPPSGSVEEAVYYVNDVERGRVFGDETNRIQNLGAFNAGETIYVKVEFDSSKASIDLSDDAFFQLDKNAFESTFTELNAGEMNIEKYSDTRFVGTITADENEIVMTSIPYDAFWNVYVDGERVETYKVLDSLLAFDISAGEHTIELKYSSKVFNTGVILGICGLGAFVVMCVFEKKFRRKMGWDTLPCSESTESVACALSVDINTDNKEDENNDLSC